MVKLVSAKCPNCGSSLKLSKEEEKVECEYCHNTIIVEDAIACYKLKISGNVSVEGITTNAELIEAANELVNMNEFLKAKRKFLEFSEKCPDNYQGWLGLLICRTRNFTIRDNNILFENDINKYYDHFLRVAPENIKEEYYETIDRYFDPEKYKKLEEQERLEQLRQEREEHRKKVEEIKRKEAEAKERRKMERQSNETYKKISNVASKGKNILVLIIDIALYILSGMVIIYGLSTGALLYIILGISFLPIIYKVLKEKFNVSKLAVILIRIFLPFWIMIIITAAYSEPSDDVQHDNNQSTVTEKVE